MYVYISIYLSISLSLSLYIYIYIDNNDNNDNACGVSPGAARPPAGRPGARARTAAVFLLH